MITGFNTDVEHRGQVFHVQTEEKGPANPIVVSLVYCGGEIVGALEVPYSAPEEGAEIRHQMLAQHQVLIRAVQAGKYDPVPLPYGHDLVSNRSLDELVLDYLGRAIDEAHPSPALPDEAHGDERARGMARTQHTARVLQRLERMLDAARRAETSAAAVADPVVQGVAEHAPVAVEAQPPSLAPQPFSVPSEPLGRHATEPLARRHRLSRFAVAALLAAASLTLVLLVVRPALREAPEVNVEAPALPAAPSVELAPPPPVPSIDAGRVDAQLDPVVPSSTAPAIPAASAGAPARQPEQPRSGAPARPRKNTAPPVVSAPEPPAAEVIVEPPAPDTAQPAPALEPEVSAATPARMGDLVDLASVDVRPLVRRRDLPRYTASARRAGQQGTVELAILIDERGEVSDVTLLHEGVGSDLVDESLATARGWTFSPARKDRQAVKVWQEVAIDFTILPNRSTSVRIRE